MKTTGVDRNIMPCVGICSSTALGTPFCIGCGRLEDDVHLWNTYNTEKKLKLTKSAKKRLQDVSSTNRT